MYCRRKTQWMRLVPPFSVQSLQKNTKVMPLDCHGERKADQSLFRMYFDRGDLPVTQPHGKRRMKETMLTWRIFPGDLNYFHYLPIFFDGLEEIEFPYSYYARSGVFDMIHAAGNKVLPVIPQLILPIKKALNTKKVDVVLTTLSTLRHMLIAGIDSNIGVALVPYYQHFLPVFNILRNRIATNRNGNTEFNQHQNLVSEIDATLQMLEQYGGPDAFVNIKYIIPTYESCVKNV